MHPILFEIGGYRVPAYGAALLIAFAVGIYVAQRRAEAQGLDGDRIIDLSMLVLATSLIGARSLYVLTHLERFRPPLGSWTDAFNPFQSSAQVGIVGLSMLGGVVLATVSALVYLRVRSLPVLRIADVVAPSVALGAGITRLGCFLNGCCYGLACGYPWAVRFPEGHPARLLFPESGVHPTQLYASLLGFLTFGALILLARRRPSEGAVVCAFLILTGAGRIAVDLARFYEEGDILLRAGASALTVHQAIGAALIAVGIGGLARLRLSPR
jgi:phosphatidylglycerol:prolipoprotein diacylglycerol transferase